MSLEKAAIALHRFGLGVRPGDLTRVAQGPDAWLRDQLESKPPEPAVFRDLPGAGRLVADVPDYRATRRMSQEDRQRIFVRFRFQGQMMHRREIALRLAHGLQTKDGFHERLVRFWSNHFTVSIRNPDAAGFVGAFEREAIRPHVTGRFADLLLAATRHPAMQLYLDNAQSIGPGSRAGQLIDRGLNENLAREILELHTLGADGGYTQADVIALAKILTGWSVARGQDTETGFRYFPFRHEPGDHVLLGQTFQETRDEEQGVRALTMLAEHASTATFVCTKLARHFIADDPPEASVKRLERAFRDTKGDLKAVSMALVDDPELWKAERRKFRPPEDFMIAALRATAPADRDHWAVALLTGLAKMAAEADADAYVDQVIRSLNPSQAMTPDGGGVGQDDTDGNDPVMSARAMAARQFAGQPGAPLLVSLQQMGQVPFQAPSPEGWPDRAEAWAGPDAVVERVEWCHAVANRIARAGGVNPADLADVVFGPAISDKTRFEIAGAASPAQGIALLLAAPEMQFR